MSIVAEMVESETDRHFEVVDGSPVENSPMGLLEAMIASHLDQSMGSYARQRKLGRVVVEDYFSSTRPARSSDGPTSRSCPRRGGR